jgi:GNAT superfamily N-acetyltransferase
MMHGAAADVEREALEQWSNAVRRMASPLPGFEEVDLGSATAVFGNVPFSLVNNIALRAQPPSLDSIRAFASSRNVPWTLLAPDFVRPDGLDPMFPLTYMAADDILPAVRTLPDLEYQAIDTPELAGLAWDINCDAYALPRELGRTALSGRAMWERDATGFVAFLGGEPVSTASVVLTGNCRNVILVATDPGHRRLGYAEAVMRRALEAAGQGRTVLHASEQGYPIYLRMGYQPLVRLTLWMSSH